MPTREQLLRRIYEEIINASQVGPLIDGAEIGKLAAQFQVLNAVQKRFVQLRLCELALAKWHAYASLQKPIRYRETVCGTDQEVDVALPHEAMASAKLGRDLANIQQRCLEPIVAMQDEDLVFPQDIKFAYYSLYNLFRRHALGAQVDDWLIVSQALAAEPDLDRWAQNLNDAIACASEGPPANTPTFVGDAARPGWTCGRQSLHSPTGQQATDFRL